jgi:hypothetical protein
MANMGPNPSSKHTGPNSPITARQACGGYHLTANPRRLREGAPIRVGDYLSGRVIERIYRNGMDYDPIWSRAARYCHSHARRKTLAIRLSQPFM